VNKSAVVHCQTVLSVVAVVGSMWIILFALAGVAVEVEIGNILPATIHVVAKTFLTALFVFSTNLLDLLEFELDSIGSM
jgi:type III secretory pathway component EscU